MAANYGMLRVRRGEPSDVPAVLAILDRAAEWLMAQGRTGQWGTGRQSTNPRRLAQAQTWTAENLFLAFIGDQPAGALVVASSPSWDAPAVDEPEIYVRLVVVDPSYSGLGVGTRLLDHARELARDNGVALVRLDCYAGGDGKLVRYYQSQGFTVISRFDGVGSDAKPWPGALLEQRLTPPVTPPGSG